MSVAIDGRDILLKLLLENSIVVVGGVAAAVVAATGGVDGDETVLTMSFQTRVFQFLRMFV